jgi:hypothetical protein
MAGNPSRVSGVHTSSRLSTASFKSGATSEDNARFLVDVEGVDVFPPASSASRRKALVRGARALAVHDDTLTHAQRRELLHVAEESDGSKRSFEDVFDHFLDVIGASSEEGSSQGDAEEDEGGEEGRVEGEKQGRIIAQKRGRFNFWLAGPFAALVTYGVAFLLARRFRSKYGPGGLWVALLGLAKLAAEHSEDAREWLWEGLCEGARSRFFENCFVLVVGRLLSFLPGRLSGLLEWIVE